jgi:chemotaxis protein methyltransferase CheR
LGISSITSAEFECFSRLIYEHAGIFLAPEKKIMVASRLTKRLNHFCLSTYAEYFDLVTGNEHPDEFQVMINILTTNETYFFREPKHFAFFRDEILKPWRGDQFRVWSAASSSGEEAYSLAMVMAENLPALNWEIFGSDLSTEVLETAQNGVYLMDRLDQMEPSLLEKYCLRGVRSQSGFFRVSKKLRDKVRFAQVNLKAPLPTTLGKFDVIFLRNVLIYFDQDIKKQVVERLMTALKPGGYFFVSHSESLHRVTNTLQMIRPSIYRKP